MTIFTFTNEYKITFTRRRLRRSPPLEHSRRLEAESQGLSVPASWPAHEYRGEEAEREIKFVATSLEQLAPCLEESPRVQGIDDCLHGHSHGLSDIENLPLQRPDGKLILPLQEPAGKLYMD